MDVAIVGSGMAGFSCIKTLLERGVNVTLIDAGEQLSTERQAAVDRMKESLPSTWLSKDVDLIRSNYTLKTREIPLKLHFGDDYVYADKRQFSPTEISSSPVFRSFAEGGFSTVWGGAVLPYRDEDLSDWPVSYRELEPYYRKILEWLPLSAREDSLAERFPILKHDTNFLEPRGQERLLQEDLARAFARLRNRNIWVGAPRLTVSSESDGDSFGCNHCGFCLTGCPRNSIWSSVPEIRRLIKENKIRHVSGRILERLSEDDRGVELSLFNIKERSYELLNFSYVFLAAGPVNTSRILLESLDLIDIDVTLKESAKFIVPWIRFRGIPSFHAESTRELPSAFLLMQDEGSDNQWIDIQVSPANYLLRMRVGFERMPQFLKLIASPLMSRVMLCLGSIHSDRSPRVRLRLLKRRSENRHVMTMVAEDNPERHIVSRSVANTLRKNAFLFRALPLPSQMISSAPGGSFHIGGGFPMRRQPRKSTETDVLGRPKNLRRVHVVDATVFPSVPGTTLGLSIMANACRIASQTALD